MDKVRVRLKGSYGYVDPVTKQHRFYGPSLAREGTWVPEGLAESLGLEILDRKSRESVDRSDPLVKPPSEPRPLPEGFPGYKHLVAAKIETYEAVPRNAEGLTAIDGIGPSTAEAILNEVD